MMKAGIPKDKLDNENVLNISIQKLGKHINHYFYLFIYNFSYKRICLIELGVGKWNPTTRMFDEKLLKFSDNTLYNKFYL